MTPPRRALPASLLLVAAIAVASPASRAEAPATEPSSTARPTGAEPLQRLAQKTDDDKDVRKGKNRGKGGDDGAKQNGDAAAARQNAIKAKQEAAKARQDAAKAKLDAAKAQQGAAKANAGKARQDAIKAKQDAQAARLKAIKDKQNAGKAQDDAAKANALKARQDAVKAKQDAQAARLKAAQDKQDAARAKLDAAKGKEDAARSEALKRKQETEAARAQAIKAKQDAAKAQQDALEAKQAAAARKAKGPPVKYDQVKADAEFDRARKRAQERSGGNRDEKWQANAAQKFEALRKGRKTREVGSQNYIVEPDKRVIVRNDNRTFIRHDDAERFTRKGRRELRRERRKDGLLAVVTMGLAGALIYSLQDDEGRVVRRSRKDRDGREFVLFDDRHAYAHTPGYFGPGAYRSSYIDLPPPVVNIARDRYIVDYDRASPDDVYDALSAPPIETLDRGYSLDEVRQNYSILERMRRVDLDTINFDFASWEVPPDQYPKLERLARAVERVIEGSAGELFLIEGHTDAVGDEIDNLSLSDRRAESVAIILSDSFGIPPENLTTQGFGEEYLKEETDGPSWINRRVSVRRVTPLLSREGWDDAD